MQSSLLKILAQIKRSQEVCIRTMKEIQKAFQKSPRPPTLLKAQAKLFKVLLSRALRIQLFILQYIVPWILEQQFKKFQVQLMALLEGSLIGDLTVHMILILQAMIVKNLGILMDSTNFSQKSLGVLEGACHRDRAIVKTLHQNSYRAIEVKSLPLRHQNIGTSNNIQCSL